MATNVLKCTSNWFCSHYKKARINHRRMQIAMASEVHSNSNSLRLPPSRPVSELVLSYDSNVLEQVPLRQDEDQVLCSSVKRLLCETKSNMESFKLIDVLQRLSIDHHFSEYIVTLLKSSYKNFTFRNVASCGDAALLFRLLRQAGYNVPSDIFCRFLDGSGEFRQELKEDTEGLINLYEASFLNTGEEYILYKAKEFSRKHLVSSLAGLDSNLATRVRQTLELPFHTSLQRYKTRQYLDHQEHGEVGSWQSLMKQLARSDFIKLQTLHQIELNEITRWWRTSGLGKDLWFARDQHLKWYVWSMAIIPDAGFSKYRILLTKVIAFIYLIDDIYDVHGSANELSLFTEAMDKWDLSATDSLPGYMRVCYNALHKITSEVAEIVMKEHRWNPTNSLAKSWVKLCKAFWVESKWFASKHVPATDVYLRNGITSSGTHIVFVHLFFLMGQGITEDSVQLLESYPRLLSCPAAILRLYDDLGSAKDEKQEGYDGSYLECYKKENPHCTEEGAREEVERMIAKAWEELNKECFPSSGPFSNSFRTACLNLARMVKVMYTYTEDQNLPMLEDCVNSLLFRSVI